MKRKIIQECEVCCFSDLVELFELTEDEIENCYFDADPDYFNWLPANKIGLYKIPFVEVLGKYIIVPDDSYIEVVTNCGMESIPDKCKLMLSRFFDEDFKQYFSVSDLQTWVYFSDLQYGIAYRGGSGYAYTLYKYNPRKK